MRSRQTDCFGITKSDIIFVNASHLHWFSMWDNQICIKWDISEWQLCFSYALSLVYVDCFSLFNRKMPSQSGKSKAEMEFIKNASSISPRIRRADNWIWWHHWECPCTSVLHFLSFAKHWIKSILCMHVIRSTCILNT